MKLLKYILSTAALTLMMSACSSDEPETPSGEGASDTCELVVTLDAGITSPSRAPITNDAWQNGYPEEEGKNWENTVNKLDLYFIPAGQDGARAKVMVPETSVGDDGKYEYRIRISVNEPYVTNKGNGEYALSGRIVALANYPNATPANPLNFKSFDIDNIQETRLIPMWGVTTITDLTMRVEHTSYAGEIKLLRAVPKITFSLHEDIASEYKITKVVPAQNTYLNLAYAYPTGASTAVTTQSLKTEDCFNPVLSTTDYSTPYFWTDNTSMWCYVSERNITASRGNSFTVTLQRKDGSQPAFSGTVYLCDYVNGKPDTSSIIKRLVRNHDYQYIINLSELKFIVSFKDWVFGGNVHLELE